MSDQSINKGIGLRLRGKGLYEAQVRDENEERRQFYRENPNEARLNPLAAHEARMGPSPADFIIDPGGMKAWFGLLGRDVKMRGGPGTTKAQDLATGRTYSLDPNSIAFELPPSMRKDGLYNEEELRQESLRGERPERTQQRLLGSNAVQGLYRQLGRR